LIVASVPNHHPVSHRLFSGSSDCNIRCNHLITGSSQIMTKSGSG